MDESKGPKHGRKIGETRSRPRLLLATREGRVGGAERLILQSLPYLTEEFDLSLTTCPLPWESPRPLVAETGPADRLDPREILFGQFDLLYTHLFIPGLLARIRRLWDDKVRWVHAVHMSSYEGLPLARLREWIDRRWIRPAADRLVAVSPTVAAQHPDPAQIQIIENALDLEPRDRRPALPERRPAARPGPQARFHPPLHLITVSMLRAEKGLPDLLKAVALLMARGRDPHLSIAGDGPLRSQLQALAEDLGITDRITLHGFVTEIQDFYAADSEAIYLQPSRSESFGLAALEAFRFGLPVITTPVGHLPTLLGEGRWGRLADADRAAPEALADAIEEVAGDRDLWVRRSEEGRAHWAERLDPARRAQKEVATLRGALLPRVVHVAPVATHGGGGLQRQVLLQTRGLADRGHRVFLLQRRDDQFDSAPQEFLDEWSHLSRWEVGSTVTSGDGSRLRERLLGLSFLTRGGVLLWQERHRYDLIHAHQLYSPTLIGALISIVAGKKLIVRVTASGAGVGEVAELGRLPFRRLRRFLFRRIDRIIALSDSMRSELIQAGFRPDRVVVIPNAVRTPPEPVPQPRPVATPSQPDAPISEPFPTGATTDYTLLFAGRFSEEKRIDTLIDALELLRDRGMRVRLRLAGRPDPDRDVTPALLEQISSRGLEDRVEWIGFTSDMHTEFLRADAFVLPSRSEGMSNALLEAMAAGMVCLASDIPQNRALLREGVEGHLFPVGDAAILASRIAELVQDRNEGGRRAQALGGQARARMVRLHAPASVTARVAALYREVAPDSVAAQSPGQPRPQPAPQPASP